VVKSSIKARVAEIILDAGRAIGVKLTNGKEYYAKKIVSNATRWDTFEKLLPGISPG
jgi:prolycopene isomerase